MKPGELSEYVVRKTSVLRPASILRRSRFAGEAARLLEEAVGEHAFVSGGTVVYDFVEQNARHTRHEEADNLCVERP